MKNKYVPVMLVLALTVALTSGCARLTKIKNFIKKHTALTGAIATGVAATGYFFRKELGLKHKKKDCKVGEETCVLCEEEKVVTPVVETK